MIASARPSSGVAVIKVPPGTSTRKAQKTGELFDRDASRVLNRKTPFRLLKRASLGDYLPAELQREALVIVFTRGLMLGEKLSEIAKKMADADPDLAPLANAYLRETMISTYAKR